MVKFLFNLAFFLTFLASFVYFCNVQFDTGSKLGRLLQYIFYGSN
jgi:hypothetical protein